MNINWRNIFSFGGGVVAHELAEQALTKLFSQAGKHGADFLKGNILGIGTDDEALFRSAVSYAVFKLGANPAEINRVIKVIGDFPFASRSRIIQIIGKDEQEITMEVPVFDEHTGHQKTTRQGKPVTQTIKQVANVRGGDTLFYLSKLTDQQIKDELVASNMTNTMWQRAQAAAAPLKSGFDQIGQSLNSGNTLLDRWADKFR